MRYFFDNRIIDIGTATARVLERLYAANPHLRPAPPVTTPKKDKKQVVEKVIEDTDMD